MTLNDFAREVTLEEGLKVSLSIAQVREVLKVVNRLTQFQLYPIVRKLEKGE